MSIVNIKSSNQQKAEIAALEAKDSQYRIQCRRELAFKFGLETGKKYWDMIKENDYPEISFYFNAILVLDNGQKEITHEAIYEIGQFIIGK